MKERVNAEPADRPALRRCVAMEPASFAADYWGRQPLLSRAGDFTVPKGFDDLLDAHAVDELLSRRGLRTPFLRLAKNGDVIPAARYTGSGGAGAEVADQVLDDKVLGLLADGATLVLQGLHRIWPPIADLAVALRTELGHPVQVNAYLTPAGNRGFATHYDTHDVFVLQCAGRKRWRVHPPVFPDPLERQPWGGVADEVAATADQPPALDVVLDPGDGLYLPRGWLHAADALDERSLHLTIGVKATTRYALVEALLALAAAEPELRAGLPMGLDVTDPAELAPHLTAAVTALRGWLDRVEPAAVADRLRDRVWPASRPAPIRPLAQLDAIDRLDADSRVRPRAGLRWRVARAGERVTLALADRTLSLPASCEQALRVVLAGPDARVGDLPLSGPDALVLVKRLLREGLLTVVS
jgi:lysine-specific demethylase/histidyl-hydroxylase NO66